MRQLVFTKLAGKVDQVEFLAKGTKVVVLQNPKQKIIPHDMVHYIIEKSFPFQGFISLVFQGHDPNNVLQVLAGVAPKLPKEYSTASWITESLVESFQAVAWSKNLTFPDFKYLYEKACEARDIEAQAIEEKRFTNALVLFADLSQRWSSLDENQSLKLEF